MGHSTRIGGIVYWLTKYHLYFTIDTTTVLCNGHINNKEKNMNKKKNKALSLDKSLLQNVWLNLRQSLLKW